MKRIMTLFLSVLLTCSAGSVKAQDPITEIIRQGIIRVIRAVDLRIQRLQNQTIWLQNAQKAVENTLSHLRLDEISGWVDRQRSLYQDYFQELATVKTVLTYYQRIRDITENQAQLIREYRRAYNLVRSDDHFTPEEIRYIGQVYAGILEKSGGHLDKLFLVLESFVTSMSDAERLDMIQNVDRDMDACTRDLRLFNQQNALLRIQRAQSIQEVRTLKNLYGIE